MNKSINFSLKLIVLLFFHASLFAQNYYVDAINGEDENNGKSVQTAWKTIDKLNCAINQCEIIESHDRIFFKRGSVFSESSFDIDGFSNLSIGAFGKGAKPIISHDTPANINIITSEGREGLALGGCPRTNLFVSG